VIVRWTECKDEVVREDSKRLLSELKRFERVELAVKRSAQNGA
jgi:hypothetical protein